VPGGLVRDGEPAWPRMEAQRTLRCPQEIDNKQVSVVSPSGT
jgi:hypothetical protein